MKQAVLGSLAAVAIALGISAAMSAMMSALVHAQAATPFKLGTFERQGKAFVGVVVGNTTVIDLAAAHAAVQPASTLAAPVDMKDVINRYDTGLRARIQDVVRSVNAAGASRPAYVYDLAALKVLPPIMYPTTMLNVAVNYREHDIEMARCARRCANGSAGAAAHADGGWRASGHQERARDTGTGRRTTRDGTRTCS